jgi:hypothetical protein
VGKPEEKRPLGRPRPRPEPSVLSVAVEKIKN